MDGRAGPPSCGSWRRSITRLALGVAPALTGRWLSPVAGGEAAGLVVLFDLVQAAAQFGVISIPTMILFKNGAEAHRVVGAYPKAKLLNELEPKLAV